jgi:hypothetical protein
LPTSGLVDPKAVMKPQFLHRLPLAICRIRQYNLVWRGQRQGWGRTRSNAAHNSLSLGVRRCDGQTSKSVEGRRDRRVGVFRQHRRCTSCLPVGSAVFCRNFAPPRQRDCLLDRMQMAAAVAPARSGKGSSSHPYTSGSGITAAQPRNALALASASGSSFTDPGTDVSVGHDRD